MPKSELVDYFDRKGHRIGYCSREESEDKNLIIANAIIFIFDSSGRVWLQKRATNKKHYPGLYDTSACGAIEHGERPILAAIREQQEEMGFNYRLYFARRFLNSFSDETDDLVRTRLSYLYVGISNKKPAKNYEVDEFVLFEDHQIFREALKHPEKFVPSMSRELGIAIKKYEKLKANLAISQEL